MKFLRIARESPAVSQATNQFISKKHSRVNSRLVQNDTQSSIEEKKQQNILEFKNSMKKLNMRSSQRLTSANESSAKSGLYGGEMGRRKQKQASQMNVRRNINDSYQFNSALSFMKNQSQPNLNNDKKPSSNA